MRGKTSAVLVASMLLSPLAMANIARASELESELRFRDATTRAEAEVETGTKTKNGVTKSKVSVEFGISQLLALGGTPSLTTGADLALTVGGVSCTMAPTTDPIVKTVVKGAQTFQRVSFHGSFVQITPAPLTPPVNSLSCTGDPSTLMVGDPVTLSVSGLQPDVVFIPGTLKLDD
ncbi:MAG: hypothetical protein EXR70_18415 [Deltaproteobacteria bacterium]|nr:hypothetical protein [Deltaproteobacteria bacterium]